MEISSAFRRLRQNRPLLTYTDRDERERIALKRENLHACDEAIAEGRTRFDSKPLVLQLEMTNHCNIKCVQCPRAVDPRYVDHHSGFEGTMTLETFRKLEPILPQVARCLVFGFGEPLMNPHFLEILGILKDHAIDVTFNTNALTMSEKFSRFFVEREVDNITFSIDGATAETYDFIRAGSSFERVTANIKKLAELRGERKKPYITIAVVLMSANVHEAKAFVELTRELGSRVIHFEPLLHLSAPEYEDQIHAKYKLSAVPLEAIVASFDEAADRAAELGVRIIGPYVDPNGRFRPETLAAFDPTVGRFAV